MPKFEQAVNPNSTNNQIPKSRKYKSGRFVGVKDGPGGTKDYSQAVEMLVDAQKSVSLNWQEGVRQPDVLKGNYFGIDEDLLDDNMANKYCNHLITALERFGKNNDNDHDVLSQLSFKAGFSIDAGEIEEAENNSELKKVIVDKMNEKEAFTALFIKLGKEKFPDVKISDDIRTEYLHINKPGNLPILGIIDANEMQSVSDEKLYDEIEDLIRINANINANNSSVKFLNNEKSLESQESIGKIPVTNESLYKLVLMREALKDKIQAKDKRLEEMKENLAGVKISGELSPEGKKRFEEKKKEHEEQRAKQLKDVRAKIETMGSENKEQEREIKIPRGWTYLKHGSNFMNWAGTDLFNSDQIVMKNSLSAISKEAWERDAAITTGDYNTTKSYSRVSKPAGMSEEQFAKLNKPLEIRVLFYKDHIRRKTDPEYAKTLDEKTKELISVYYFKNIQHGRHELVPRKEVLIKLDHKIENGIDVFYFVPQSVLEAYEKEAGVKVNKKLEMNS